MSKPAIHQVTNVLERMQMRRDDRAANLRYFRDMEYPNESARGLCHIQGHGENLPRPALRYVWPIQKCGRGVTARTSFDAYSWQRITLLPADATEWEISLHITPMGSGEPGKPYAHEPHIDRGPHSIRISQRGGIDV